MTGCVAEAVKQAANVLQDAGMGAGPFRRLGDSGGIPPNRTDRVRGHDHSPANRKPMAGPETEGAHLGRNSGERTYKTIETSRMNYAPKLRQSEFGHSAKLC
jgi:hypothetical protein